MIRSRNSDNSGAARAQKIRWQAAAGGPSVRTNIGSLALGGLLWNQGVTPQNGTIGPITQPMTVPDVMTDLSSPETNNGQATIKFTPGSDGGRPITNYRYSLNGGVFTELNPPVTKSPVTIKNLYNGTVYTISLQAINAIGTSPPSAPITVTPCGPPDRPIFVSSLRRNGSVQISFRDGNSNGGCPITGYWYAYSTNEGINYTPLSSTTITTNPMNRAIKTMVIDGLNNATKYVFVVAESNINGKSEPSNNIIVNSVSPPDAPLLTSFANGSGSVNLFFTAGSDNGSSITNYLYSLSQDSGTTWTPFTPLLQADTDSPITVTGLIDNLIYSVKLKARNAFGDSSESNTLAGITALAVPMPLLVSS